MSHVPSSPFSPRTSPLEMDARTALGARPVGDRRVVTTLDGVRIAVHDLGGRGQPVVFAHGAGLHGLVWRPVADSMGDDVRRISFDGRAHGDSDPAPEVEIDWRGFGLDVLGVVDGLGLEGPFGVGHSSGATALLLAEQARPGAFRGLYCFEPVLVPADPALGRDPDSWLAEATRSRRADFASRAEALAHYRSRPQYAAVDPGALAALVDHGFADVAGGAVRLKCPPEQEAMIYVMATAHDAYPRLADVRCPVMLAKGELTDVVGPGLFEDVAARLPDARSEVLTGVGHLGPLEAPAAVARSVRSFMTQVAAEGSPRPGRDGRTSEGTDGSAGREPAQEPAPGARPP